MTKKGFPPSKKPHETQRIVISTSAKRRSAPKGSNSYYQFQQVVYIAQVGRKKTSTTKHEPILTSNKRG